MGGKAGWDVICKKGGRKQRGRERERGNRDNPSNQNSNNLKIQMEVGVGSTALRVRCFVQLRSSRRGTPDCEM